MRILAKTRALENGLTGPIKYEREFETIPGKLVIKRNGVYTAILDSEYLKRLENRILAVNID